MKFRITALLVVGLGQAIASSESPYVGEELNEIKSLSASEIDGLLQGSGMGFAKVAELNQFPGPRHVLDLAESLGLSDEQVTRTNEVFEAMRNDAIELGTRLVEYERSLDELFSSSQVTVPEMDALLL